MKKSLILAIFVFLSLSTISYAQDDTAIETLQGLNEYTPWLATLVIGYVSSKLTKILNGIGWLSTDNQKEITKLVKMFLGVIIPASLIILTKELTPLAEQLDSTGVWPLIVACITFAKGTHILDKFIAIKNA